VKGLGPACAAAVAVLLLSSTAGYCATYQYTLDTGSIGTAPFGYITTTVDGANLDVTVNVAPNYDVDTGTAHWALTFDLATSGLTITGLPFPFYQVAGSSFTNAPFTASPFNYAIDCSGAGNGSKSCGKTPGFSFVIVNGGALMPLLTDGVFFAVDILDARTGKTGVVGASSFFQINQSQVATPLPTAFPLFATGLGALGLLGWRRKRKPQSITA
jgi:hypothetical protein